MTTGKEDWKETGRCMGKAFTSLAGSIMGSIERGAGKAEEWADSAKAKFDDKVENAAQKAEEKADNIKQDAKDFAAGLMEVKDPQDESRVVADAEIISEETVK